MIVEDTVISIERGPMTMEAILLRDQRTTSHRVLDREQPQSVTGTMPKTKIGIKDLTVEDGNDPTEISCLLEHSPSSRICRSTCCTRACSRSRLRRLPCCRYLDDENSSNKKKNDDRVSVQRHFRCDVSDVCRATSSSSSSSSSSSPSTSSSSSSSSSFDDDRGIRSRRGSSSVTTTTWLRLSSLLVTLLVVSVHGAPMTLNDRRLSSSPKWVNPCGHAHDDVNDDPDVEQLSDSELMWQVVLEAQLALDHALIFRDNYIRKIFNIDFADLHSQWKDQHYNWLPSEDQIPKQLGEQLSQEYLQELKFDKALLDAYEYMQKYAVGLEQIVWDQEDNNLDFRDEFKAAENKLRTVLCELQVALMERAVTLRPDVKREVMSAEFRSMSSSATFRDLRDWLIFRDYMNGLEYVIQVFEHLLKGAQS